MSKLAGPSAGASGSLAHSMRSGAELLSIVALWKVAMMCRMGSVRVAPE
jgi:hypothetical protein